MDKLADIFARQASYVEALVPTYIRNGFLHHAERMPWVLDSRHSQEEYRLLAWRFTEEVLEAVETHESVHTTGQQVAYHEEVSDALHFFIELCIASGVTREQLLTGLVDYPWKDDGDSLEEYFNQVSKLHERPRNWHDAIRALGLAMMQLKQRPWRVDNRPTSHSRWVMGLHLTFTCFVACCIATHITAPDLYRAYFRKAKTNDQRIKDFGAK